MYLKTLEIQGFKSFPEKTVIDFHKGVTAIVGPNGSGKSNITDAIRWVLGEQSVKTLRGSKMEDVIFSGTKSRRAMGFAEVTIVIDNSEGKLPFEYSEVAVSRRLYRSGESEYLINKSVSRLKDVQALFMDTGIGRDGYSIISQGKVNDIISPRSEDRRKIFDEASGIVKYKTRKEEAERKLSTTSDNLLRVNDIIAELEIQIGPLKEQSETARKFLAHRDELKTVEISLFLDNIDKYNQKYNEYTEEYNSILNQVNQSTLEISNLKLKNTQLTEENENIEKAIEEKRIRIQNLKDSVKELHNKIEMNNGRALSIHSGMEDNKAAQSSMEESLKKLTEEMSVRQEREKTLKQQLDKYSLQLAEHENNMAKIVQSLSETEKKSEEYKLQIDELTDSLYEKKFQAGRTGNEIDGLKQRESTISNEIINLTSETDLLKISLDEVRENIRKLMSARKTIEEKLAEKRSEMEKQRESLQKIIKEKEDNLREISNVAYRINILEELEKSREGYSSTVKDLMDLKDKKDSQGEGIVGLVGELLQTEPEYSLAIETALGSSIQNIVTKTEYQASALIEYLKKNRLGRATFLPLSSIQGKRPDKTMENNAKASEGFLGFGSDLVSSREDIPEIIIYLLGRIVIMDNLDHGIKLAGKSGYSFKIVTLEGDVINPGGALTGGYRKEKASRILGRGMEIEGLKEVLVKLDAKKNIIEKRNRDAEQQIEASADNVLKTENQYNEIQREILKGESSLEQVQKDLSRTSGRLEMLKGEHSQIQDRKTQIYADIQALENDSEKIQQEIDSTKSALDELAITGREEEEQRDILREYISDLKISVNSIEESIAAAKEIDERISREKEQYISSSQKRTEDMTRFLAELEKIENENLSYQAKIESLTGESEEEDNILTDLRNARENIEKDMSEYFQEFEKLTVDSANLQSDLGRADVKRNRIELSLDEVKNRLWEEYELTVDTAEKWRGAVENAGLAQKKVNELKRLIKDLGNININAIEEYDKVSQRYEFLVKQRNDIEESKDKLLSVIRDLTGEMRNQFSRQFKIINENFKEVFADIFGGGTAEIVLGDESDILNCDIDIIAQPPGKNLKNMLLLSGGEISLTAISLLFAILKLKPAPFCVLDEIETSLDDVNVMRFADYIKERTKNSQFILVTHRKGTMEVADMIYGVTMQERGISKILSMRLSD